MVDDVAHVADEELLYRRVVFKPGLEPYKIVDGKLKFGSQAFADPNFQPSVDIASKTGFNPQATQQHAANGVTSVLTGDVRKIHSVVRNEPGGKQTVYSPDVQEDPIDAKDAAPGNAAHALIVTH